MTTRSNALELSTRMRTAIPENGSEGKVPVARDFHLTPLGLSCTTGAVGKLSTPLSLADRMPSSEIAARVGSSEGKFPLIGGKRDFRLVRRAATA